MVKPVNRIIPDFARAGANVITFHPEASEYRSQSRPDSATAGCQVGLVFNPATFAVSMDHVTGQVDVVLLMSVAEPVWRGEVDIVARFDKLRRRARIDAYEGAQGRRILLEIDGGVDRQHRSDRGSRCRQSSSPARRAWRGARGRSARLRYMIGALRAQLCGVAA